MLALANEELNKRGKRQASGKRAGQRDEGRSDNRPRRNESGRDGRLDESKSCDGIERKHTLLHPPPPKASLGPPRLISGRGRQKVVEERTEGVKRIASDRMGRAMEELLTEGLHWWNSVADDGPPRETPSVSAWRRSSEGLQRIVTELSRTFANFPAEHSGNLDGGRAPSLGGGANGWWRAPQFWLATSAAPCWALGGCWRLSQLELVSNRRVAHRLQQPR